MLKVLFALNQTEDTTTEDGLLESYKELTGKSFEYKKEYDRSGVTNTLMLEKYDVIVLNEELERDSVIPTSFVDELTDKHSDLRIIFLAQDIHKNDTYIRKLFNIGTYDVLYANDVGVDSIINLISTPRTKIEAKAYLNLSDVEDAVVQNELTHIPDDQLYNILSFLERSEASNMSNVYEHIYSQYNEKQMMFLDKYLSENIKEALKNNKLYKDIAAKVGVQNRVNATVESSEDNSTAKKEIKKPVLGGLSINMPDVKIVKSEETVIRDKLIGSVFIGIANTVRGAGSSYISLAMASYLVSLGMSVAILEINPHPCYSNFSKDKTNPIVNVNGIDIYYKDKLSQDKEFLIPEFKKSYQYVISDLGIIRSFKDGVYSNDGNYQEFIRSTIKILMVSGVEWKWGEIFPFLINNNIDKWNVFVSPTNKKLQKIISKDLSSCTKNIYHLPFIDDPLNLNEEIIDIFDKALDGYIGGSSKNKLKFKLPKLSFGNNK